MQQTKEPNLNTSLGQTCSSRMKKHNLSGGGAQAEVTLHKSFQQIGGAVLDFNVTKNIHTEHFKEKCR